jgi:hypothetical protein
MVIVFTKNNSLAKGPFPLPKSSEKKAPWDVLESSIAEFEARA